MLTSDRYRRFAVEAAHDGSPCYQRWSLGVADDPELLALIDELPVPRRIPNMLFAAARLLGIPVGPYSGFRGEVLDRWPELRAIMRVRRTQTNEAARCATLLPVLAALPQPLALLEVGASAGLCLFPDRYSYRYDHRPRLDPPGGPGTVVLECVTSGDVPFPVRVPEVAWRAGIDLNPLDVTDPDDVNWLDALIWPEHDHRRRTLAAALDVVRADPPRIVTGDLNERLPELAAQAPRDATLVVIHSAVLVYLTHEERATFIRTVGGLDGHWIANEAPGVVPGTEQDTPNFVTTLDGNQVALASGHGHTLHWGTGTHQTDRRRPAS